MLHYIKGLPEYYRVKAEEKQYDTLAKALEASAAIFNARKMSGAKGPTSSLHHMEAAAEQGNFGSSSYAAGQGPQTQVIYQQQHVPEFAEGTVQEQLTAIFTKLNASGAGQGSGNYNNSRGRAREGSATRARSRSSSKSNVEAWAENLSATGKLTPEEFRRRLDGKLCINCGQAGHINRDCPTRPKSTAKASREGSTN